MNKTCEMVITDFFKLSTGHIALVGAIEPNLNQFIPAGNANLVSAPSSPYFN